MKMSGSTLRAYEVVTRKVGEAPAIDDLTPWEIDPSAILAFHVLFGSNATGGTSRMRVRILLGTVVMVIDVERADWLSLHV